MLIVRKSELAKEDLINTWLYGFGKFGEQEADNYLDDLEEKIESLANAPERYTLKTEYQPAIRICPHRSQHIIYMLEKEAIYIVRVLRKEMDIKHHL